MECTYWQENNPPLSEGQWIIETTQLSYNANDASLLSNESSTKAPRHLITFQDLTPPLRDEVMSLHGETVHIRGFWIPITEHEGILSKMPHVKSCCIHKVEENGEALHTTGDVSSLLANHIYTLEGIFEIHKSDPFFFLKEAKTTNSSSGLSNTVSLILFSLFIALVFFSFLKKRRTRFLP